MKLTRLRADLMLLLVSVVWGGGFAVQKVVMEKLGPFTFMGMRFAIAALVVLPFAIRELPTVRTASRDSWRDIAIAVLFFVVGTLSQQVGMTVTTVTNAGFLTTLYVVMSPFLAWAIDRVAPRWTVLAAAALSMFGIILLGAKTLGGGLVTSLNWGDLTIVGTAFCYAGNIFYISRAMRKVQLPATLACLQGLVTAIFAWPVALALEVPTTQAIVSAAPELIYTGIISGGFAFLLQGIAQRHTPAADAAIIIGSESLWAAIIAYVLVGERISSLGLAGAAAIVLAIILVEAGPYFSSQRTALDTPR
jgi:drug/metabolite transporter (DMT)-like permease